MDEQLSQLRTRIAEQLDIDPSKLRDDALLMEDLGADSLDLVEMAMTIEEMFDLNIPSDDYPRLATIRDAERYIRAKKTAAA